MSELQLLAAVIVLIGIGGIGLGIYIGILLGKWFKK